MPPSLDNARNTVDVELIDTGVMVTVCTMNIKFLMPQCMQGPLAYETSFKGSNAVHTFSRLGSYSRLFAKLVAIKDNNAHVMLVNPYNVHLSRSLIDSGLVRRCLQA